MISLLKCPARFIESDVLPEAVGPVMTMSFFKRQTELFLGAHEMIKSIRAFVANNFLSTNARMMSEIYILIIV
jgi:hypothetical protein